MATGITGLFSAGDLASAENQSMRDRAMAVAKLGKGEAGAYAAGLGSGMLIEGLAGMAGMKTRAQKKQEDVQNILSRYSTADQNDPKVLFSLSQDFIQAGYPQLSQSFAERARTLSDTLADNAVNKQKAETEATKAETAALGMKEGETKYFPAGADNPGKEKMMIVENGQWVDFKDPTSGEVLMKDSYKPDAPSTFEKKITYIKQLKDKVDPDTGELYTEETINRMISSVLEGGSGVNITFTGDDAYAEELGKSLAEDDKKLVKDSQNAVKQIEKTNSVLRILNRGEMNIGAFSTIEQSFDRVKAEFGFGEGEEAASETQLLNALLGSDVFPLINQLGIGARGLDTPAERDFLQAVFVGTVKMEGAALEQLTRLRQKYSTQIIQDFNNKVDEDYFKRYNKIATVPLQKLEIPKMVRPNDKEYKIPDGQGGFVNKTYPIMEEDKDSNSPTFGMVRWQYRPDGPYYSDRGVDITSQFEDATVTYIMEN